MSCAGADSKDSTGDMRRVPVVLLLLSACAGPVTQPSSPAPPNLKEQSSATELAATHGEGQHGRMGTNRRGQGSASQASKRLSLYVLPLKTEAGLTRAAKSLDTLIITELHNLQRFDVMGPDDVNAMLRVERMRDTLGCDPVEMSCNAEVASALGAPRLVTGKLLHTAQGGEVVLSLALVNTRSVELLARASARGSSADEDVLAVMMARVIGDIFDVRVTPPRAVGGGPQTYAEYTRLMQRLGRLMANHRLSELLAAVAQNADATMNTPPGTSLEAVLTFYRATACARLGRAECLRAAAAHYLERWPSGMYVSALQNHLDQLEDRQRERESATDKLQARLAEIEQQRERGGLDAWQVRLQKGYAYFSALRYERAAETFNSLLRSDALPDADYFDVLQMASLALEKAYRFEAQRELLLEAQKAQPKAFRRQGLHHALRRIPK